MLLSLKSFAEVRRLSPQHSALASELHDSFVQYVTKRVDRLGMVCFDVERSPEPSQESGEMGDLFSGSSLVRSNPYIPKVVTTIVERMVAVDALKCDGIFRKPCSAIKHEMQKKRMKNVGVEAASHS